jgi:hypothetical protein
MGPRELVCAFIGALEAKQWDAVHTALAEEFLLRGSGPNPQVINKDSFLTMHRGMQETAPDLSFQLHIAWARGNAVSGSMHLAGTFTGNYVLPSPDNIFMLATGQPLYFPRLEVKFLLHGTKIGAMLVERPSGSHASSRYSVDPYALGQRHPLPGPFHIPVVMQTATFPIYGLVGTPLGLTLRAFGHSYAGAVQLKPRPLNALILSFAYPPESRAPERSLEIVAVDPAAPYLIPPWDWREVPLEVSIFDDEGQRYDRYATAKAARTADDVSAPCLIDKFPLIGGDYSLRFEHWRRPQEEWSFAVYGPSVRLTGYARGVARCELLTLLQESEMINERLDVIGQYQAELAAWLGYVRG